MERGQRVLVTHPFHPLHGKELELIDRRRTWGKDRVYLQDEDGQVFRLPASWTGAEGQDPFVALSGGRSHFRPKDLLRLVALVSQIREGARAATCQGNDAADVSETLSLSEAQQVARRQQSRDRAAEMERGEEKRS